MKTKLLAFAFLALASLSTILSGCKETEIPINFSYKGARAYFNVPVTTDSSFIKVPTVIKFNVDSLCDVYKFKKEDLKYIKMKTFKLTIDDVSANPYTFDKIKDIFGYAINTGGDLKFVTMENIPQNGAKELTLNVMQEDIQSFIQSNAFEVTLELNLRGPVEHPFRLIGDLEYTIDAIGFEK